MILARAGIRKRTLPQHMDLGLRWGQRLLVWMAVLCALVFRNPAVVNYEVTGVLFGRSMVLWQFLLLIGVVVASLVITRPWCNYLCPIRAFTDFVGLVRKSIGLKNKQES
jgi:polyferredoxin